MTFIYFVRTFTVDKIREYKMNNQPNTNRNKPNNNNSVCTLDSTLSAFTNSFKESLMERDFQILRNKVIAKREASKKKRHQIN